ncbi:hypothetical protein I2486_19870 [Cellulophaga sp. E16_2]|uniref:hypothetical protein n=1 Tax=Cellulophaga sp. E16_2 TaxID=2789297 RepID=UPI001A910436|nr:hypothetical protein [Cellulophaga sp. E16_2]MBO0593663.1 hypothetical protein [Cellulophaga sp. E16_2]
MNKAVKTILKYVLELLIVAFGVFLGFYISNINAEKETKKDTQKSINSIIEELESNQKLIVEFIEYHENIKVQLDSVLPTMNEEDKFSRFYMNDKFKHNQLKGWIGFQYARLENTAFESSKISGVIRHYDIELIQEISKSYTYQQTYIDFGTSILNKAIATNSSTSVYDFYGIIELMTSDLLNLEKRLSKEMMQTIKELKKTQNTE